MRKFGVFSATIFITILLAGLYGILHDQITYSISPEYFTKFKYRQFGFVPSQFNGHRQTVAVIGFLATWWMGLLIGLLIALFGLLFQDHLIMKKKIKTAIKIVFVTAIVFAIIGFWVGNHSFNEGSNWLMPADLIDRQNFIVVGSIHNYSYIGGIMGLIIALFYLIIAKSITPNKHKSPGGPNNVTT